jgi:hypothetical protein
MSICVHTYTYIRTYVRTYIHKHSHVRVCRHPSKNTRAYTQVQGKSQPPPVPCVAQMRHIVCLFLDLLGWIRNCMALHWRTLIGGAGAGRESLWYIACMYLCVCVSVCVCV